MHGTHRKLPTDLFDDSISTELPINNHEYVEQLKNNFKQAFKLVKENRHYIMDKAKLRHDRQIAGCNFKKGDKVWLLFQSRLKGITSSIAPRHSVSYTVLEFLNNGTNYIIKHDAKRSRAKTVNRRQLRLNQLNQESQNKLHKQIVLYHNII
jgi:hypothetical protein